MNTDAVPGAVNGLLGRFAAANAVAFEGTELPRAHVTGTPVRPELSSLHRSLEGRRAGRTALGLPADRQTVTAMGGSLGALRINRAVAALAGSWEACGDRTVYHVTGRRDYDSFAGGDAGDAGAEPGSDGRLCYRVVPFEERMPELYSAADVCVSRAGAMSVAELLISACPRSSSRCPAHPATTRPATPRPSSRWARRCTCLIPSVTGSGSPRSSRRCSPTPAACGPWGRRRGGTPIQMPQPASPSWSMPMPAEEPLDLREPRRIHVVGIGGAGMSAIGLVLRAMGHTVSGSDLKDSPVPNGWARRASPSLSGTGRRTSRAPTSSPIRPRWHPTTSSSWPPPRRARTSRRFGDVGGRLRHPPVPRRLGTHGKTTTASMLSLILVEAGLHPSFVIGADVNEIGTNAVWDSGEWLVVEADESYGTFKALRPDLAVLTNVEPDHLDYYGTFEVLREAFSEFVAGATLGAVACADDEHPPPSGGRTGQPWWGRRPAPTT